MHRRYIRLRARDYGRSHSGARKRVPATVGGLLQEQAQLALTGTPGVTVLVHDQECAAELRRKRKRGDAIQPRQRVMINERVCEGCGDCGVKSNCLSVHPVDTELGRKTQIDQSSCNFDFSCLKGDCPAFMTIIPDDSGQAKLEVAPWAPMICQSRSRFRRCRTPPE